MFVLQPGIPILQNHFHEFFLHEFDTFIFLGVGFLLFVALPKQMTEDLGNLLSNEGAGPGEHIHKVREDEGMRTRCQLKKTNLSVLSLTLTYVQLQNCTLISVSIAVIRC